MCKRRSYGEANLGVVFFLWFLLWCISFTEENWRLRLEGVDDANLWCSYSTKCSRRGWFSSPPFTGIYIYYMYILIIPYQFVVISSHLMYLMCCQEDGLVVPSLACLEVALLESLRLGIRSAGNTGMLHWRCNVPGMIPPKKMWTFVTCDEMWYHNVWLHLTAFQGTYWQRSWWRRKYAFGQCLKFYTECQCLLLNSFSSDLTSTGSAPSESVLLPLRLIRLVSISLVQFPSHPFGAWVFVFLSTLACSCWALDGWNRMEPVALQEPRWRAGSHVLHPQGALGRGSSEVHPSASCPLVHWSQLNYHQVDLREWNREATRHSIMSPEDLGWIQKQCTFIILAYILHPLDILCLCHGSSCIMILGISAMVRQARRQGVLSRLAVPWVQCTLSTLFVNARDTNLSMPIWLCFSWGQRIRRLSGSLYKTMGKHCHVSSNPTELLNWYELIPQNRKTTNITNGRHQWGIFHSVEFITADLSQNHCDHHHQHRHHHHHHLGSSTVSMYQHSALSENCCNRCFKYCRAFLTSLFFHFSQKNSWQASLHSAPRFPTQSGWVRNHLCDSGDSCGMKWRVPSSSLLCRWLSSPQCVYDMARDPGYLW